MAIHEIRIDPGQPLAGQPGTGHNRWHPGITPVIWAEPGDEVVMETRDAVDGQIGEGSVAADIPGVDISVVHPLTGPVHVAGAEPGDMLVVDILDVSTGTFGYTMQSPGFGFLRDDFPEPFLAHTAAGERRECRHQAAHSGHAPADPGLGTRRSLLGR